MRSTIFVQISIYRLNCTKFAELILKKIIKYVATRFYIFWEKCTKSDFGWGSYPDSAGGAHGDTLDP